MRLQIDWDSYFGKVFEETEIGIDDTERIILVEPEFFDAFVPLLASTDSTVIGKQGHIL